MQNKSIPRSQNSLPFFGIVRESFKIIRKNKTLLFPVLILVFLIYCQLDFTQYYVLGPVEKNFVLELAAYPTTLYNLGRNLDIVTYHGAFDELLEILLVKHLHLLSSLIPTLFFLVAIVLSTYEAYTYKLLGPKEILLKIGKCWNRVSLTSFCMLLITFGIMFIYLIYYALISYLDVNSWSTVIFFGMITITVPFWYFYLAALWMVSLIVSVLEEGPGGYKAIGRAVELMSGKRLQASLMMVPFVVASAVVYHLVHVIVTSPTLFQFDRMSSNGHVTRYYLNKNARLTIEISLLNASDCLLKLYMFVVYTVFFHEQKTNLDEKEVKDQYLPVVASEA
uniref:uncharacterized protein LOC122601054 n=1 Tax=Erigeron canadensis TaxID=72917 RepID=UPI001CB99317|nr:uncharacterized protein LOC122601054 [Erigeron canadensis]